MIFYDVKRFPLLPMKRPNSASLILFGFSLGLITTANAGTLGSAVFGDVPGGAYFDSAVGDMYAAGIITGYQDGRFGPNDYVTRGQVAVMMQRFKAHLTGQAISVPSSSTRSRVSSSTTSSSSSSSSVAAPTTNGAGSFRFTTGSYKVDEDKGSVTISVIRYGGNAGTVSVDYVTDGGLADAGSDYDLTEGTITFADGKTSGTFTVPIVDDNESESTETVILKLKNPSGGNIGSPAEATLSILDNDAGDGTSADPANSKGVFVFSASEYEISEELSSVTITVDRTSGSQGSATVKFEAKGGTADSSNYDQNSGTLSFADGETSKTFDVTVKGNSTTNGNKTVNLKLSVPSGGASLGSLSTSSLIIVDDEVSTFGNGKIRLKEESHEVAEGGVVRITIDRISGAKGDVTIDYTTKNSLAKSGDDYTETSGTLTFKEGESQKIISVPVLSDDANDPRETFKFELSNATGGATLDSPAIATITIQ